MVAVSCKRAMSGPPKKTVCEFAKCVIIRSVVTFSKFKLQFLYVATDFLLRGGCHFSSET